MTRKKANPRHAPVKRHYVPTDVRRSSLSWSMAWRKSIYKIQTFYDTKENVDRYRVYPRNPAWDEYIDSEAFLRGAPAVVGPHLDPVDFNSLDEVNQWAEVVLRVDTE